MTHPPAPREGRKWQGAEEEPTAVPRHPAAALKPGTTPITSGNFRKKMLID